MSDNYRSFEINVDLGEIIDAGNMEAFNDLVEEALTESGQVGAFAILSDISYEVVGRGDTKDEVRVKVTAEVVNEDDPDADEQDNDTLQ